MMQSDNTACRPAIGLGTESDGADISATRSHALGLTALFAGPQTPAATYCQSGSTCCWSAKSLWASMKSRVPLGSSRSSC